MIRRHSLISRARRRGATAVEFAIVAPIFFVFFLSIIEFSRAFMVTQLLTDAARRGCRLAIIEGVSNSQITSAATTYLSSCNISGESVSISINDAAGNTIDAQNVPAYSEISVTAQVPVSNVTWLPVAGMQLFYSNQVGYVKVGPDGTSYLSGQFTMRRE